MAKEITIRDLVKDLPCSHCLVCYELMKRAGELKVDLDKEKE